MTVKEPNEEFKEELEKQFKSEAEEKEKKVNSRSPTKPLSKEVNLLKGLRELCIEHKGPDIGYSKPQQSPLLDDLNPL